MTQEELNKKLLNAACRNNINGVIEALSLDADVNSAVDKYGNTTLMYAVSYGNTDIVKLLLENRTDVNTANKYGEVALMWACRCGNTDILKLLLEHGADISLKDKDGKTVLDILEKRHPDKYSKWTEETVIRLQRERLENEDSAQESITGYEFDI